MTLARLLSFVWPVRVWKDGTGPGMLELTWEYGRLVVNSPHANQSFGSLHRVWRQAFRDGGIARRVPKSVLILGYGAGSAAQILRNELHLTPRITGVDQDPRMFDIARRYFPLKGLPPEDLALADAFDYVREARGPYDLIIVDLFQDLEFADGICDPGFLRTLRRLAPAPGRILLNTVAHDEKADRRSARLGEELRLVFTEVTEHHYDASNRVFIAL